MVVIPPGNSNIPTKKFIKKKIIKKIKRRIEKNATLIDTLEDDDGEVAGHSLLLATGVRQRCLGALRRSRCGSRSPLRPLCSRSGVALAEELSAA